MSAQPKIKLVEPKKLPKGVATHRSIVVRGKPCWAWKPLSSLARINVQHASRPEFFDREHLERVLDARAEGTRAMRKK